MVINPFLAECTPSSFLHIFKRVEARLASLLMESKEYSEALSVLSGLIKESTVRVSHRLPLVFFVVSELKHRSSSSCFHCTQKYAKGNQEASYPQEAIDEVRNEWAETVFQFIK
ncbi:hypothetical protein L3X38_016932 [Prunus dulcis]|uniref:Uncharacterized protein n=1 Tax=Prunus dulcis TaxID=3755 RepID=A0AAD4W6W2_PRUDU|nr:hypothetical protein L3X38_016932 [Prunus dulcis]